mgnify:CR=1 FL=1
MDPHSTQKNTKLIEVISASPFGSISRLAEHLGIHYNCIHSYITAERSPIDRHGYVKYDVAGMCAALECEVADLFPEDVLDRPYRLRETYDDGYGRRATKQPVPKHYPERSLCADQAKAVVDLLDARSLVRDGDGVRIAEELVRRLSPEDFEVFSRFALDGMAVPDIEAALGISGKAVRARYTNALRRLNSPATLRTLQGFKDRIQTELDSDGEHNVSERNQNR